MWLTADGSCNYHTRETRNRESREQEQAAGSRSKCSNGRRATGDLAGSRRKMKPIQKQTPGATTSALDEY